MLRVFGPSEWAGAAIVALLLVHVVACIKLKAWALMVFGAIVFPVGVIHGAGSLFGFF